MMIYLYSDSPSKQYTNDYTSECSCIISYSIQLFSYHTQCATLFNVLPSHCYKNTLLNLYE